VKRPRLALVLACVAWCAASGCAGTPPLPADVTSPIVEAGTVGGCAQPSHKPFPAYQARVPYTGEPRARTKVAPAYPDAARREGTQGVVVLAALVCEHGRVVATRVIESIPALDAAATDAVRQWVFQPAMIQGVTIAAWTRAPVRFTIR
jgi:protein TonB